jgi:hypothetical protein
VADGVTIGELTSQEIGAALMFGAWPVSDFEQQMFSMMQGAPPCVMVERPVAIRLSYSVPVVPGGGTPEQIEATRQTQRDAKGVVEEVLLALRLLKPGRVGLRGVVSLVQGQSGEVQCRLCEPLGVYPAATPGHNADQAGARGAFAIAVTCRTFVCSRRRAAPPFAAPRTTHNREAGGSNPPGAMPRFAGIPRRGARQPKRSQTASTFHQASTVSRRASAICFSADMTGRPFSSSSANSGIDMPARICSEAVAWRRSYGGRLSIPASSRALCQIRRHQFCVHQATRQELVDRPVACRALKGAHATRQRLPVSPGRQPAEVPSSVGGSETSGTHAVRPLRSSRRGWPGGGSPATRPRYGRGCGRTDWSVRRSIPLTASR